jgi:hypothetical protein
MPGGFCFAASLCDGVMAFAFSRSVARTVAPPSASTAVRRRSFTASLLRFLHVYFVIGVTTTFRNHTFS